jgi:hypothetical protein
MTTDKLLLQILEELQRTNRPSAPLGFGHPPKPRYIYANRQYPDCLWYFWNGGDNKHEPIALTSLTGTIEKLEIETKEFRGKPDPKVNLHIRADRNYIIQAGADTLFAKGLLFTLSKLPPQAFEQAITIAVEPGETEQVLFCRIYNPATGQSIYAPYPDDTDWAKVTAKAISKVNRETKPETPIPELDGQQRLMPDDYRGAADVVNQSIADATSKGELEQIGRNIETMRDSLGPMASALLDKVNVRIIEFMAAEPAAIAAQEMERVGWSKDQGRDFLMVHFQKRTRAELTPEEMETFIGHLKNLPKKQPVAQGDWP